MEICERGLEASPTKELLIEESLLGWKEFEMEVVRDHADNCIIICSIENLDPMGVHTGDSITVAPAQTLTDKEYQIMRDASIAVLREIGVDTGGSNVQFSINPEDGRMVVIEMNPRVSRSSALASKATGFPIAKVAAKLAVGYTLDELQNEITGGATPASFEPTIDYVVTKIPRFAFEKFPQANDRLTTQMKSVGEVMAIGRTFQESFQKALRGLEVGVNGLDEKYTDLEAIAAELGSPGPDRIWAVGDAFRLGMSVEELFNHSKIDPWFLVQIEDIVKREQALQGRELRMRAWRNCWAAMPPPCARAVMRWEYARYSSAWILAPLSSLPTPPTCILPTRRSAKLRPRTIKRLWCWAAGRIALAKASSSITAVCMQPWQCAKTATRPSWSTATRRPCLPITIHQTACISNR